MYSCIWTFIIGELIYFSPIDSVKVSSESQNCDKVKNDFVEEDSEMSHEITADLSPLQEQRYCFTYPTLFSPWLYVYKFSSGDRYLISSQMERYDIELNTYMSDQKEIDRRLRLQSQMAKITIESDEDIEFPSPKRYNRKYSNTVFF